MAISTYLSIITLNVNGLNVPLKRHRVAEWIQKQDPYICCLQETHFRSKDTHRLKVRGWKKVFHANGNQKKVGVAILFLNTFICLFVCLFIYLWLLLSWSTGSRHTGSVVVAHGLTCSVTCGIFLDQGSNPCPLHWQADS